MDKVLALPVTELPKVIQASAKCVTTDLSVSDIIALAEQFKNKGDLTMYSAMAPSAIAPELINGVSYVLNDPAATKKMMTAVESGEDPSTIVSMADPYSLLNQSGGSYRSSSSGGTGYY